MESRERMLLNSLEVQGNLRTLNSSRCYGDRISIGGVEYYNFSNNDYLGLGSDVELQREFFSQVDMSQFVMSNPSSRLMTGDSDHYTSLESSLERLYTGRRALVLSNGYAVNSGVLPAITSKSDLIVADKLVHASIIDGLRLCDAKWERFAHNDMEHLEAIIVKNRQSYERIWVVTESVFSMDGDVAPISKLVELKSRYDLHLYLDEAHGFGVYGDNGAGYAYSLGLDRSFDVIIATMGKALASVGAFVICDSTLRDVLINRMRTLIFSTALPPINLMWSRFLVDRLGGFSHRRECLTHLIDVASPLNHSESVSQIIPIMTYDNDKTIALSNYLRQEGYWVTPIRTPTVPKGRARIRVSLTATISEEVVRNFVKICNNIG